MRHRQLMPFGVAVLWATALVAPAGAQDAPIQRTPPSTVPGLQVQELESGFVVAPDARFTEINDRAATLAGGYAGWQTDRTLFIGGAAYWLANRDDDFRMRYAGGMVRWTIGGHRRLGLSTGALIGVGNATLGRTYGDLFGADAAAAGFGPSRGRIGHDIAYGRRGPGQVITSNTLLRVDDNFVIAEPQVSALWRITPWVRLDLGVGYRFIGAADLLGAQLRGPSGSVALQFGGR